MNGNTYPRNYIPVYQSPVYQQNLLEQTEYQMNQLQQIRDQIKNNTMAPQQPTLNQTIQLAPTPNNNLGIKFVNSVEDVEKELVIFETPFIQNDYSKLYIKNNKGEIRTFEMMEIIPIDDKDKIIEQLKIENNILKGMIDNESGNANNDEQCNTTTDKSIKAKTTSDVSNVRTSKTKSK